MFSDFLYEALELEKVWFSSPFIVYKLGKMGLWFDQIAYIIGSYLFYYKFWQISVFSYGIAKNFTQDEIYNPQFYPYLFDVRIPRNQYDTKQKGTGSSKPINHKNLVNYVNPYNYGFINNLMVFIKQALCSQLIIK